MEKLGKSRSSMPVFRVPERSLDDLHNSLVSAVDGVCALAGLGKLRHEATLHNKRTFMAFQSGIKAQVYHASGALAISRGFAPFQHIIATDASTANLNDLEQQAKTAINKLNLVSLGKNEKLKFERLWKLKAGGVTEKGEFGPIALTEVVGAFRRYLGNIPVYGAASQFVQIVADNQVSGVGVDWRRIEEEPFETAKLISAEEGAERLLQQLQVFLPERPLTMEDYTPDEFLTGYFSLPKRRAQNYMQPVFIAKFLDNGPDTSLNRLIAIPAGVKLYEPIDRIIVSPPPMPKKDPSIVPPKGKGKRSAKKNK